MIKELQISEIINSNRLDVIIENKNYQDEDWTSEETCCHFISILSHHCVFVFLVNNGNNNNNTNMGRAQECFGVFVASVSGSELNTDVNIHMYSSVLHMCP